VKDHDAVVLDQTSQRVGVGGSCVDHDRLSDVVCECELRLEQPLLRVVRGVVAEVVEAGLADRNRARVLQELAQLVEVGRRTGLVRMDPEGRVDALVRLGELERPATAGDGGGDVDDARDAGASGALEYLGGVVAEVRVGVDHAASALRIRSSSSSTTESSSFRKSCRGSTNGWPGRRTLGSQLPVHDA